MVQIMVILRSGWIQHFVELKIIENSFRKNITEMSILLMLLSYERQSTSFKFVLTKDSVVNISEELLN